MTFLLDTNVVSELRKVGDGRADANVVRWISGSDAAAFQVSAITLMELELGVRLAERRDPAQGARLRAWLEARVMPEFAGRVLPVDTAVALRCAGLHVPDPRPERDAFIAATALVHGMVVVTRNIADFRPTGVQVIDSWSEGDASA
ncbi:type II toxin-antitoxin system VapC family toxin [Methylobacterium sp. NEAU 140]|uniref:type II toxin-antitoxin system VapC family toxin n=1 Tax=Methylobacterium sp. NEAU 140 TaxID=3064945 RepID=UPI0027368414|nr:type II toxin-antitoxin system VapC family toxin [Methylobacterium sp. NEAU 140]MDP4024532.1 type II toxin-antitoxin system VapC family toxin [Methylobacterium sp. NEAU 140]